MPTHPNEAHVIDEALVRHIAFLIRLELTDAEVALYSQQLRSIVDYVDRLAEVDVEDVPPYRQPPMGRARLRDDVAAPSMARQDFLANAPQQQDGFVRVPVVLGGAEEG
jgi:aspartyl-tRNA(Asn)/glutamyl-tRNA(Gln) amidotransferase subunit C